jgi:hypothetical protein
LGKVDNKGRRKVEREVTKMGMSTHIVGIKPTDEDFMKMLKVYNACHEAGVDLPKKVLEFFSYEEPDPSGIVVDLPIGCIERYSADGEDRFEVNVEDLPEDIKIIRFYNSW